MMAILLGGCSFSSIKQKAGCVTECNSDNTGSMIYSSEDKLALYEGGFNISGEYEGKGIFLYRDGSRLNAESSSGFVHKGVYSHLKGGEQHTILFSGEKINPEKIGTYNFKNKVKYEKVYGGFSYHGGMSNLLLRGEGQLFKDDLFFAGKFENMFFKGEISNNDQTRKFEIEDTDNSVRYTYKNGVKTSVLQGHFSKNVFNGVQTEYIKEKEIISYKGHWGMKYSPFEYEDFKFDDFEKKGQYTSESNGNVLKGDFKNNQREGYFDVYKSNKLMGFNYYDNNKKLYYVPLYLEMQSQLKKGKCSYVFPETLNLWTPYNFKSCKKGIYIIEFIDKENKNLLFEMKYNKKIDKIIDLVIYDQNKKYEFTEINHKNILGTIEYTLDGNAKIYKWINNEYVLLNISKININTEKKAK